MEPICFVYRNRTTVFFSSPPKTLDYIQAACSVLFQLSQTHSKWSFLRELTKCKPPSKILCLKIRCWMQLMVETKF